VKGIYVGIATLVLTVAIVSLCAIGAQRIATGEFNGILIANSKGLLLVICVTMLVALFKQLFTAPNWRQAIRAWVRGCLEFLVVDRNYILLGSVALVVIVLSTALLGVVTVATSIAAQVRVARDANVIISSLREDLNVTSTKLARLEAEVQALVKENEELRATIKKAAASSRTSRGQVSCGLGGREFDSQYSWRQGTYVGQWECTAYNPVAWQCDSTPEITATGNRVQPGYTAAIDPRYWRFGTRFYVSGFGEVIADDTGGAVKGFNRIDICVQDVGFARQLGRWTADVWLIE